MPDSDIPYIPDSRQPYVIAFAVVIAVGGTSGPSSPW